MHTAPVAYSKYAHMLMEAVCIPNMVLERIWLKKILSDY